MKLLYLLLQLGTASTVMAFDAASFQRLFDFMKSSVQPGDDVASSEQPHHTRGCSKWEDVCSVHSVGLYPWVIGLSRILD